MHTVSNQPPSTLLASVALICTALQELRLHLDNHGSQKDVIFRPCAFEHFCNRLTVFQLQCQNSSPWGAAAAIAAGLSGSLRELKLELGESEGDTHSCSGSIACFPFLSLLLHLHCQNHV